MDFPLKYWLPYKLNFEDKEIICDWLFVGEKLFLKPFFDSTISDCKNFIENQSQFKPASNFEAISEFSETVPYLNPTAFIFHVSRSGSTLLSQLFSLDSQNIVVAEAPFFDQILREIHFNKFEFSKEEIIHTFKSAIKYYGKKRQGNEQNYFIKLDSWLLMYYEIIRKAFPNTPFIFSYRKPNEVIASHKGQRGMQAVPGLLEPAIFGIDLSEELLINQDLYIIEVLKKYYEKLIIIAQFDKNSLFIDYSEGVLPILGKIERFLSLKIKPEIKVKMIERTRFDSKNSNEIFAEQKTNMKLPVNQLQVEELYGKLKNLFDQ